MNQKLQEKINELNEKEQYGEIIELLEMHPEQDYDTILCLAEAYNQRGQKDDYEKSIEILNMVADLGGADTKWNFLLGYAYYQTGCYESALRNFAHSADLDMGNQEKGNFFYKTLEKLQNRYGMNNAQVQPPEYDEADIEVLENFIDETFGEFDGILEEEGAEEGDIEICVIPPDEGREFYTLVTVGMGAFEMDIPEELEEYQLERAELIICLPPDWKIFSMEDRWQWPIRLLKNLARLPFEEDTWIGWGHTIDNGQSFDDSTEQCGSMLIKPVLFGEGEMVCVLPDGRRVNFYHVLTLYREEMEYKMEHGANELLGQLDDSVLFINPKREKFCIRTMLS